jgi:hypothetical protein
VKRERKPIFDIMLIVEVLGHVDKDNEPWRKWGAEGVPKVVVVVVILRPSPMMAMILPSIHRGASVVEAMMRIDHSIRGATIRFNKTWNGATAIPTKILKPIAVMNRKTLCMIVTIVTSIPIPGPAANITTRIAMTKLTATSHPPVKVEDDRGGRVWEILMIPQNPYLSLIMAVWPIAEAIIAMAIPAIPDLVATQSDTDHDEDMTIHNNNKRGCLLFPILHQHRLPTKLLLLLLLILLPSLHH